MLHSKLAMAIPGPSEDNPPNAMMVSILLAWVSVARSRDPEVHSYVPEFDIGHIGMASQWQFTTYRAELLGT